MAPRHLWSSHQARTVREFQEVRAVLVFDQKFQDKNDYALLKPAKPPRVGKVSDPKSDGRGLESEQKMWFLGPKILRRRLRQKDIGGCLCVLVCASRNSCFQIEEAPHTMRVQLPPGGFKRSIGFPSLQSWDDHVIDSCLFGSGAWFNHKKMRCDVTGQEQLLRETP